jgi:hypothetical protein
MRDEVRYTSMESIIYILTERGLRLPTAAGHCGILIIQGLARAYVQDRGQLMHAAYGGGGS